MIRVENLTPGFPLDSLFLFISSFSLKVFYLKKRCLTLSPPSKRHRSWMHVCNTLTNLEPNFLLAFLVTSVLFSMIRTTFK